MRLGGRLLHHLGQAFQRLGNGLVSEPRPSRIWIDVGAHLGERTIKFARRNPSLLIYAFEPNLKLAAQRIGLLPNFVVIPMAVAQKNGCADFYINTCDAASSLLPFHSEGLQRWIGREELSVERTVSVPTIRLDTFMEWMQIPEVEYLKVDAQGMDLSVIKSAGERLRDIRKITLEVAITPSPLYVGAPGKNEIVEYVNKAGFVLENSERQSHGQEENMTFVRRLS